MNDASQDQGLPVLGGHVRLEIARVEDRPAEERLAGDNRRGFSADLQRDIAGVVDVRGDFENDPDVLVLETLVQRTHVGALAFVDEGHLLADEEFAQFIVRDVDLGRGQHGGIRGLAQELDEEIHVDRSTQDAGAQIGHRLGQGAAGRGVDGSLASEALHVIRAGIAENRVVEVIGGEGLAAIGRPANPQLVEEIAGDFHDAGLDQDLGGGRVQLSDQLHDLREEMEIRRDEQRVASLIRHHPHPAHQVADRTDDGPAVRRASGFRLPAQPGKVAVLLGLLFQPEAGLRIVALLLLLLLLGRRAP